MLSEASGVHQGIPDRLEIPKFRRYPSPIPEYQRKRLLPVAVVQDDVVIVGEADVREQVLGSGDVRVYSISPLLALLCSRPRIHGNSG